MSDGAGPGATGCARTIAASLIGLGVRHAVLAPGSRSAPLAFALEQAAREHAIELHVRIDERSAGYLALGLAKAGARAGGSPVVPVITTSGTAVANLLPAVAEASHAGIGLLVISADRPATMWHTGANQTTDQVKLFGGFVRAEAVVSSAEGDPRDWAFQVARLVAAASGARTHEPGPAQLNVSLAEPLTPGDDPWPPVAPTRVEPLGVPLDPVALPAGPRTVVVAGDATAEAGERAYAIAERGRCPLIAEPSSGARRQPALRTGRLLLATSLAGWVERVLTVGHPTLSRPVSRLLSRDDVESITVAASAARWHDPGRRVTRVVDDVTIEPGEPGWAQRWRAADARLSRRMDDAYAANLDGPGVAARVLASLGPGRHLMLGSSNPIRDADLAPVPEAGPTVFANRGLAGIDGTISTAAGIALAGDNPVTALVGDVTLLHEVGGLCVGPLERRPRLRLVVVNDDGGSIFAGLEQGEERYAAAFERIFATPHGVNVEHLALAYGLGYRRVHTLGELDSALESTPHGIELVEAVVSRTDRRARQQRLLEWAHDAVD